MNTYTVKEISEMLGTSEETVRRWIREDRLKATQESRKQGNVVTEEMLDAFLKESPKYAARMGSMFSLVGAGAVAVVAAMGVLGKQAIKEDNLKTAKVESQGIIELLRAEITTRTETVNKKQELIRQLQADIDDEQSAIKRAELMIRKLQRESRDGNNENANK